MRTDISFLLNGVEETVAGARPDTTLLNWLRLEKGLTGTKEGCAEGDCGACTVVLAGPGGGGAGGVAARAVNACILFLPMVDGLSVTTVEGLAGPGGELHPVQEAIASHHGAQCGFCTPGFVMSLHAGFIGGLDGGEAQADRIFAGNLCRCTGYGPLVRAALSVKDAAAPPWERERRRAEAGYLRKRAGDRSHLALEGGGQAYHAPATVRELERLAVKHPEAVLVAGATDVGLWVTKQHRGIDRFISLARVAELRSVRRRGGILDIGAGASLEAAMDALLDAYPGLGDVLHRFGSTQVRNSGTLGGNIANGSPVGDMAPCLLALDASLTLNRGGRRREVGIADFFVAYGRQDMRPGEFLERLALPRLGRSERLLAYKISKRFDQDISAVMMAAWVKAGKGRIEAVRLGFGGMAATPARARATEAALAGHALGAPLPAAAAAALRKDFKPISDMRASAAYRLLVAENLLRKMLLEARAGPAGEDGYLRLYAPPWREPPMVREAGAKEAGAMEAGDG